MTQSLSGIYAAAITPLDSTGRPDFESYKVLLDHLGQRGCHGVLAAGTTGEGPSFSVEERIGLFAVVGQVNPDLRLLAGTGAASIEDTKTLSRAAFDHGAAAAVILPPFFYSNPPVEGLLEFYRQVLNALPSDGCVFLYHNPVVGAPAIEYELIARLRDEYPAQVTGIKDSGQNWDYTRGLFDQFPDFSVFVGTDRHLSQALKARGSGAITALAGIFPDLLRDVYDLYSEGKPLESAQERLDNAYHMFDGVARIAAFKWFAANAGITGNGAVRPPLGALTEAEITLLTQRFNPKIEVPDLIDLADLPDLDSRK
jgi:4-hydroxy-tetrahydrodipicolinate synthase